MTPTQLRWLLPVLAVAALAFVASFLWPQFVSDSAEEAPAAVQADVEAAPAVAQPEAASEEDIVVPNIDLLLVDHDDDSVFSELFKLWGIAYDSAAGPACDQAAEQTLRCYFQRGSWSTLQQLNRPAVITLTDNAGESRQVLLTSLDSNSAGIMIAGKVETVPVNELTHYWFGQFMLLWKPPNNAEQMIGPGASGAPVLWLRNSLAALSGAYPLAANPSDSFDAELAKQLQNFQRKHRLDADGIAGLKTQIIINSLLEPDSTPRLSAGL